MTHISKLTLAIAALAGLLFGWSCQQSNEHAVMRFEAEQSAEKVVQLTQELEAVTANNDSLKAAVAAPDSLLAASAAQWHLERRTMARRAVTASSEHDGLHARLTALGDSTVSALADSLAAAHSATVAAYEAQLETYKEENEALHVAVGELRAFVGGLELELEVQAQVSVEQQVQIAIYEKLANPPLHEKIKRAIPSFGVGASVAVIALVAAGAM